MSILYVNTITPNTGDTVTVSGSLTTTGKFTIGDADTDTVAITAELTSSIIPDVNNAFDLGSSTKQWKDIHIDSTGFIDTIITTDITASGNISASGTVFADNFQSTGLDDTISFADDLNLSGSLTSSGNISSSGGLIGSSLTVGGTLVTSTAAELNILDGVTSTAAELNVLDGVTAVVGELNALDLGGTAIGNAIASKAVVLDANKDYAGIRNLTVSGELDAATGDFSGAVDIAGDLTLSAGADGALNFPVASSVKIFDNNAAALVFEEADNAYMTFVTTNSSEAIKFDKALDINAAIQLDSTLTVGVDDTGYDVKLFGATSGQHLLWDASTDKLIVTGEIEAGSLDISGNVDVDGTLEADAITVNGVTLATFVRDTVGTNMISSNTETGITVTYDTSNDNIDFAINAAQTGITSLLATDIKIGEDDQTKIDFETADEIHFYAANAEQVYVADGIFGPQTDSDVDLGTTGVRWKDAYVDSVTSTGAITAGGIVTGTGFTAGNAVLAEAELELLDGLTAGTAIASKVVTTDANIDTTGQRNLTITGELDAATGDFSGAVDIAGDLTLSAGADGALNFPVASSVKIFDNNAAALVFEEADNAYMTFVTTNSSEAIKFDKALDINAAVQLDSTLTIGVDDTGYDVKFFGATSGKSLLWDESADSLIVTGTTTLVGTTNLDAVDIDGAVQLDNTFTVGVNDTGYDVKFFGATAAQFLLWDESSDELVLAGDSKLSFHDAAGGENIIASSDGHLEINAGATLDITAPIVDLNGTLTADFQSDLTPVLSTQTANFTAAVGHEYIVNKADGAAIVLPAAAVGYRITILIGTLITSNTTTITAQSGDLLKGYAFLEATDAANNKTMFNPDGSDDLIITLNGSTKGGLVGDRIELVGISATEWRVRATLSHTGTAATPFS